MPAGDRRELTLLFHIHSEFLTAADLFASSPTKMTLTNRQVTGLHWRGPQPSPELPGSWMHLKPPPVTFAPNVIFNRVFQYVRFDTISYRCHTQR